MTDERVWNVSEYLVDGHASDRKKSNLDFLESVSQGPEVDREIVTGRGRLPAASATMLFPMDPSMTACDLTH